MRTLSAGHASDTIFALASGVGRSAISVLRLSGTQCCPILQALAGTMPQPRKAVLRRLRDDGETLDQAIVLWLPGPDSYTGEDCAELHLHGGRAVLECVTSALVAHGARPADPGEFTRRAMINGKLDLLEAEAVADLVDAQTQAQRRAALQQLSGEQSRLLGAWRETLLQLLALQEALIDFAEDEIPADVEGELRAGILTLLQEVRGQMAATSGGERLREGLTFVLSGPPNVGKSSLLNALAGRDAAMVSSQPGTTRDPIQVHLEIAGVPVTLIDTAGIRDVGDPLEAEGVRRALSHAREANLVLQITDGVTEGRTLPREGPCLLIKSKTDLSPAQAGYVGVNTVQTDGLVELWQQLEHEARRLTDRGSQPAFSRARHSAVLRDAAEALAAALNASEAVLSAEELRTASRAIGRLIGAVDAEDVLDQIFAGFCIGK